VKNQLEHPRSKPVKMTSTDWSAALKEMLLADIHWQTGTLLASTTIAVLGSGPEYRHCHCRRYYSGSGVEADSAKYRVAAILTSWRTELAVAIPVLEMWCRAMVLDTLDSDWEPS
jgi:hypothetical protein